MSLALVGGRVYRSPSNDDKPIENAVVIVDQGKITKVGAQNAVTYSEYAHKIDCSGFTITAGFQNSHVHLTADETTDTTSEVVGERLRNEYTQYGFTSIVDAGSFPLYTTAARSIIESGKALGSRIFTACAPLYPAEGIPFYLDDLPEDVRKMLPQPKTPEEARRFVRWNVSMGADIIKLFTGSLVTRRSVKPMELETARAAVEEAHSLGRVVFCHPSNIEGINVALDSGADVLAHTESEGSVWSEELVGRMKSLISLIPTLKLWLYEAAKINSSKEWAEEFEGKCITQLSSFATAGGRVLFGTDAGYMTDFDPSEEYVLMERGGMSPRAILKSLTTAPAALFNESRMRGTVTEGMKADLVVLKEDPFDKVENFAKVVLTIRDGRVIHSSISDSV